MWKPGARRTPFPREAPLVSLVRETAGSSGVQTSAKRQAREMCTHRSSFFPHPRLPPFSHSPSLFILSLCCVSAATPLFYQINISQNKSQDNFKLAREEKRHGKEKGGREGERNRVQFSRLLWSGVSVFPLTSFWGLWFFSAASRSQCNWWGRHNCFSMPKEGTCRASRRVFTYSYHKQKSSATWQKSTDAFSDHCAILENWSATRWCAASRFGRASTSGSWLPFNGEEWKRRSVVWNVYYCEHIQDSGVASNCFLREIPVAHFTQSCCNGNAQL